MKIFVAIAAYSRAISCETARSLLNEQRTALAVNGIELEVGFAPGCCALHYTRDILCHNFLASDCDKMVFLDSDVCFEPGALIKLALHPVDIVGGATRLKRDPEEYPVKFTPTENGQLWADPKTGLLDVVLMPAGFLCISREALMKIKAAHPERQYSHDCNESFQGFFQMPYGSTEEAGFIACWRDLGGKAWLDPEIELGHVDGGMKYVGRIGDYLRRKAGIPQQVAA